MEFTCSIVSINDRRKYECNKKKDEKYTQHDLILLKFNNSLIIVHYYTKNTERQMKIRFIFLDLQDSSESYMLKFK